MGTHPIFESDFDCLTDKMVVGFIKDSLHDLYMSETFGDVRRMNKRQVYYQFLNFAMIVSSALMVWKGLFVISGTESPIVVVLSGSMEPAFYRGDLLFLYHDREAPINAGEIVFSKLKGGIYQLCIELSSDVKILKLAKSKSLPRVITIK